MNEKVVNAALLGLGTVGTGVYKVIKSQEQEMTAKLGCQVKITKILVRNLEKASGKVDDPSVLTTDWADIEGDPSIDIVIELIGGIEISSFSIRSRLHYQPRNRMISSATTKPKIAVPSARAAPSSRLVWILLAASG